MSGVLRGPSARNNLIAGGLVGAVVLVIGFGSGIGSVATKHNATSSSTTEQQLAGQPATAPSTTSATSLGTGGIADLGTGSGYTAAPASAVRLISGHGTVVPAPVAASGPAAGVAAGGGAKTSSTVTSPSVSPPAAGCSNTMLVNAMLDPFVVHLDKAHLEESPGQQVASLLNADQYTQLHLVLVEDMVMPLITAVQDALNGIDPLIVHLDKAHLEQSPGQQVAALLNTDQYVQLHTVLVEDMLNPLTQSITGTYGC